MGRAGKEECVTPQSYAEDDTPRRFKDLLNPRKAFDEAEYYAKVAKHASSAKAAKHKESAKASNHASDARTTGKDAATGAATGKRPYKEAAQEDGDSSGAEDTDAMWRVRPGESFRDFNARIREAGLSAPPFSPSPAVASARVTPAGAQRTDRHVKAGTKQKDTGRSKKKKTSQEEDGKLHGKARRQAYSKGRKEVAKARKRGGPPDEADYRIYQKRPFNETVQAPPTLTARPRAVLKVRTAGRAADSKKRPPIALPKRNKH